jgi:hypothetical protein
MSQPTKYTARHCVSLTEYLALARSEIRFRFNPECCVAVPKQVSSVFGRTAAGGGTVYTDSPNPSALSDSHNLPTPSLLPPNATKQYKYGRPNR